MRRWWLCHGVRGLDGGSPTTLDVADLKRKHVIDVLDAVENLVSGRPMIELLSARRKLSKSDD